MQKLIPLTALFCIAVLSGCGNKPVIEKHFTAPAGWTWEVQTSGEETTPMAVGPETFGILPSLNTRAVEWDGAAEPWIDQNLAFSEQTFTVNTNFSTRVATREAFSTNKGLEGTKVMLINPGFSLPLKHVQYFFQTNSVMHILTFTRGLNPKEKGELWVIADEMDELADRAAKSFQAPTPKNL